MQQLRYSQLDGDNDSGRNGDVDGGGDVAVITSDTDPLNKLRKFQNLHLRCSFTLDLS